MPTCCACCACRTPPLPNSQLRALRLPCPALHCRPGRRLQLPADSGAEVLRLFQQLEFSKHTTRMQQLWASELYR